MTGFIDFKRQSGAALAVGMILLLVLTVLGISSMQSSLLQERMSGNTRDLDYAFQSAETALRAGERWLAGRTVMPDEVTGCTSPCDKGDVVWSDGSITDSQLQNTGNWWGTPDADAKVRELSAAPSSVTSAPKYVIEFKAFSRDSLTIGTGVITGRSVYDITARGTGSSDTSQSVLRSRYAQRY